VTVDELVRVVEIALGVRRVDRCAGIDLNADGRVTVEEIIAALTAALEGCVHEDVGSEQFLTG
jgi:hypothetical protein